MPIQSNGFEYFNSHQLSISASGY